MPPRPKPCPWGVQSCSAKFRHYHPPIVDGGDTLDPTPLPSVTEILKSIAKPALVGWAFKMGRQHTLAAARSVYEECYGTRGELPPPPSYIAAVDQRAPKNQYQLPTDAVDIGTLVHKRVEAEIRRELGQDVDIPEIPEVEVVGGRQKPHPAWAAYQAYLAWRREHDVRPVAVEKRVYSRRLGFAGTADFEGYVDGQYCFGDWKTSEAVYGEYPIQLAAYRAAEMEMRGDYVTPIGGLILRFPKSGGSFEAHDVPWSEQTPLMADFMAAMRLFRRDLGR